MLSSVCLGSFHFDIAMVLRDAKLINSIMVNSEAWHNVLQKHIQCLEKVDSDLMREIMNSHSKTAIEAYYFELGKFPVRFTLSKRRFMYHWHILRRDNSELIWKVYRAQKLYANRGDWVKLLNEEKAKYGLLITDQEIMKLSKEKFKQIVDEKVEKFAINYLKTLAMKHSKSSGVANEKFGMKSYFSDRRFAKEDIQIVFALRTKRIDVKIFFANVYENENMNCRICKDSASLEDENHLLICEKLTEEPSDTQFSDVYDNTDKQLAAAKVFKRILRRRQVYMDANQI